ncbi:MAG TPA: hypothetical protein VEY50_00725 [Lysobacter sp.]|nr:hypothetical protein [Lysobacter sp.]
MNEHDSTPLPDALRWQLRALRQPQEPTRDLWPGIAAQLGARPAVRNAPRWRGGLALAATLVVALGAAVLWRAWPGATHAGADPTLVQREADVLTLQYQAALQELPADTPGTPMRHAFDDLDRNAALIRAALRRDPDSQLLLEQLRRTYTQRLALTQRLAYS